jgi:dTDP-4-amino-4,6-dideoxygalactose transaminase
MGLAGKHGLKVIEDCAHAIESTYRNRPLGTIGDFGCFSFYVTKNMTTGEGGMVCAKSQEDADRIKRLALHGMSADAWARFSDDGYKHYQVVEPGFKYNMMDLQAALGIHQLARLEQQWEARHRLFQRYCDGLQGLPLSLPVAGAATNRNAFHLFPVLIHKDAPLTRDQFMMRMHRAGIGTGVHYQSIPSHEYYRKAYGWVPEEWPQSFAVGSTTVSLPFGPALMEEQVQRVLETARELLGA